MAKKPTKKPKPAKPAAPPSPKPTIAGGGMGGY
jgi:hypothetical protein